MPKRKNNAKIQYYEDKIRKLKENDEARPRRRRVIIYSDSDSENENTHQVDNHATGSPPTGDPTSSDQPAQDPTPTTEAEVAPVIDPEFLLALGDPIDEKPTYGEKVHQNLADRCLPILRHGISKENKDTLLKELTIPDNCRLLRAPTLNPEISAAISESARTRDKKFEAAQQQLGLGISTITRALSVLVSNGEEKETKVQVVKMLSEGCRILSDLHFVETQARIKAITPALDKAFLHVIENVERDETLFGSKLADKIKASKTIEKQGLQIKKNAPPQKQAPSTSQSTTRNRYRQQSSNRGGKGGPVKTSTPTHKAASATTSSTRNHSQSKRGARRN